MNCVAVSYLIFGEVYILICFVIYQARVQRANVKLKQGKLKEAEADYAKVVSQIIFTLCCQLVVPKTCGLPIIYYLDKPF